MQPADLADHTNAATMPVTDGLDASKVATPTMQLEVPLKSVQPDEAPTAACPPAGSLLARASLAHASDFPLAAGPNAAQAIVSSPMLGHALARLIQTHVTKPQHPSLSEDPEQADRRWRP